MIEDGQSNDGSAEEEQASPRPVGPEAHQSEASVEAPPPPPPPPAPVAPDVLTGIAQTEKSLEERKALLANALQGQVASGARIESQGDIQAVVVRGHRVNHLLHFFIGLFTLGIWWIVWFFIAVFGGEKRQMVNVDQFGNTFVQKV
jgi:hypothetical protein